MKQGRYPLIITFLVPPLLLYGIFVLSPYAQAFQISTTDWLGYSPDANFVGLENFRRLWSDGYVWNALKNNAILLVVDPIKQRRHELDPLLEALSVRPERKILVLNKVDIAKKEPLLALLRAIPVTTGSVILVPARTVHAIGGGILLAEIQQPADCTYRFHDHGSERPIQPREALATVDLAAAAQVWQPGDDPGPLRGRHVTLEVLGPGAHRRDRPDTPRLVVPVQGEGRIHAGDEVVPLTPGALLLARRGPFWLELAPGSSCVLGQVDD